MTVGALAEAVEVLARAGVRRLFGMPGGGPNLDLVGAAGQAGIEFVLMHGETAACLAAAAHGAVSGTVGVAVVTRGPGVASTVNGLAAATLDGLPLLLLSDAVSAADAGRVAHQRLDQLALTAPVTRGNGVLGPEGGAQVVADALRLAAGPPAGAVHLDVDLRAGRSALRLAARPSSVPTAVEVALAAAAGRRRPVVLLGPLAGDTAPLRAALAGRHVPVLTTYQAKGWLPDGDPDLAGLFTNAAAERPLLERADLVVGVGLDPVEPMPGAWPYPAPVVLVNPGRMDGRYFGEPAVVDVQPGAQAAVLARLLDAAAPVWEPGTGAAQRVRTLAALEAAVPGLSPHAVVRAVADAAPDVRVTVDAGAHMLVAMPLWPAREPGDVLISNGLATMGFALPAAIGAATAEPDRPVVCLTGDGGLGMALAELETLARLGSRVVVVVFNDARLSLIGIKQGPGQGGPAAVGYRTTDFAAVARACGLDAVLATTAEQVAGAVRDGVRAAAGPLLVDARVDPSGYPHVIRATRG